MLFTVLCIGLLLWTEHASSLSVLDVTCQLILGVTGTGEHGVGVGKKEYLIEELGEGTVELMKTIKNAVDPQNLLNPGKVNSRFFLFAWVLIMPVQLYPDGPPKKATK